MARTTPPPQVRTAPPSRGFRVVKTAETYSLRPASRPSGGDLRRAALRWIADGRAQGWSARTLDNGEKTLERFAWWMEHEAGLNPSLDDLSPSILRLFLAYLREPRPGGRWGTGSHSGQRDTRPSTVQTYYRILRAFLNFCVAERLVDETPLRNVKTPRVPNDQVQPFSPEQVQWLLDGARRGQYPERDVLIVLLLVDTGMRVSELCGLTVGDVDRGTGELVVLGKGGKRRRVYMGVSARRSMWRYLELEGKRDAAEPLLLSRTGNLQGHGLTISGVQQVIRNAGKIAGITGVRCSPHTLRHTFAVNFLRGGGNLFELQQLMGHTDLTVLRRYVALAEADLAQAHRIASPADRMKLR